MASSDTLRLMCRRFPVPLLLLLSCSTLFAEEYGDESYDTGWRINLDNDLWTNQSIDRDYTGGLGLALSGKRVQEYPVTIDSWRGSIDKLIHFPHLYQSSDYMSFHSQQYGMTLFTPDDIESTVPIYDDRPYGSLFFMSNSEFTVVPARDVAYVSRLTIGILGLDLAEEVQSTLHQISGSDVPNGWQYQVSAGGEPTAMLTYGMQNNLHSSSKQQLKVEYEANLGFITDINAGFSWRWGRIHSPWWAFDSYQSKYMQQSMPVFSSGDKTKSNEWYLWAGSRLNVRIYNALLQGQFRESAVTVSNADMQRLVLEYWLGGTVELYKKYFASFYLRGHTDEFKGPNARSASWAGVVFSRAY